MKFLKSLVIGGATLAVQAHAATTVLTFDNYLDPNPRPACSGGNLQGPTAVICAVETNLIGTDYGSGPELAISYNRVVPVQNGVANSPQFLFLITDGNGIGSSFGGIGNAATITFTPTSGYEVSLASFDFANRNSNGALGQFKLTDAMGGVVFDFTSAMMRKRTNYAANTGYFSGPLTLLIDGVTTGVPSIDNVVLNTRLIEAPPVGGVPEPAAWAMMIAGFGLTGGAMRRRRGTHQQVAA